MLTLPYDDRPHALAAPGIRWLMLALAVALSGCTTPSVDNASDAEIRAAAYVHDGPPMLALYTMVNNRYGSGEHSALVINASQRVIFDPAGTVRHEMLIEENDVLYGVTPKVLDFYTRAHARKTHHVVIQEIPVSREVAELALSLAVHNGPVRSAMCASATSEILRQLPGFESIRTTLFPLRLSKQIDRLPGVARSALYEYDDADKSVALRAYDAEAANGQR